MERFNKTKKGYRFDKVIFWSIQFLILILLGIIFNIHGISYKPYINCAGPANCENPFSNNYTYGCSLAFGLIDCDIDRPAWIDQKELSPGEYGEKPFNVSAFLQVVLCLFFLGLCFNHIIWNKGKMFHLNIFDTIKKIEESKDDDFKEDKEK